MAFELGKNFKFELFSLFSILSLLGILSFILVEEEEFGLLFVQIVALVKEVLNLKVYSSKFTINFRDMVHCFLFILSFFFPPNKIIFVNCIFSLIQFYIL